jgi:LysR family transcriptional regulator, flagellar master operon regulator
MDIDQIKTFLGVVANGSFLEAAIRLHVTQSTVSTRIQKLESYLGVTLFMRNRSGAALTLPGQRFLRHAKSLLLTLEQARHDIGLPSRFRASITARADRLMGRIAAPMDRRNTKADPGYFHSQRNWL